MALNNFFSLKLRGKIKRLSVRTRLYKRRPSISNPTHGTSTSTDDYTGSGSSDSFTHQKHNDKPKTSSLNLMPRTQSKSDIGTFKRSKSFIFNRSRRKGRLNIHSFKTWRSDSKIDENSIAMKSKVSADQINSNYNLDQNFRDSVISSSSGALFESNHQPTKILTISIIKTIGLLLESEMNARVLVEIVVVTSDSNGYPKSYMCQFSGNKPISSQKYQSTLTYNYKGGAATKVFKVFGEYQLTIKFYILSTHQEYLGSIEYTSEDVEDDIICRKWCNLRKEDEDVVDKKVLLQLNLKSMNKNVKFEDLIFKKLLGTGGSGIVELREYKPTGRLYAVKRQSKCYHFNQEANDNDLPLSLKERNNLVRCLSIKHGKPSPFLVNIQFALQTRNNCYIGLDYIKGGELFHYLDKYGRFKEADAKFYLMELLSALELLHNAGIIFRDLKPENVLLSDTGHVKLCDFGLSKSGMLDETKRTTSMSGTFEYLAPEMINAYYGQNDGYRYSVDIWSLGIIYFEMICGYVPFTADTRTELFEKILKGKFSIPRQLYISNSGKSFINALLLKDHVKRIGYKHGASELKHHSYFKKVNWDDVANLRLLPPKNISLDLMTNDQAESKETVSFEIEEHKKTVGKMKDGKFVDEGCDHHLGEKGRREHFAGFSFSNDLNGY